jgi:hypothetical protein
MVTNGRTWFFASLMLAAALPAPASAQYGQPTPAPAQSMPNHGQSSDRDQPQAAAPAARPPATAAELSAASACVIGRNAAAADPILATAPFSAAERQAAIRLSSDMQRCTHASAGLATQINKLRGAVAEALYEARFATPVAARTPALEAAPLPRPTEVEADTLAMIAPMYQLADCATPRQPDLARAVLATDPGTPAEAAAVAALNPTFVACVPAGTQLRIDPKFLRLLFAEALYRWSVVQRDGPASAWAAAAAPAQSAAASH